MIYYNCFFLIFFVLFNVGCSSQNELLLSATQLEYQSSLPLLMLNYNQNVVTSKKDSCILINDKCGVICDDSSIDNYSELSNYSNRITIMDNEMVILKKTLYNGEQYIVINTNTCEQFILNGEPQLNDSIIFTFNEGATTDKKSYIDLSIIDSSGKLKNYRQVSIPQNIFPQNLRKNNRKVLMIDSDNQVWTFTF